MKKTENLDALIAAAFGWNSIDELLYNYTQFPNKIFTSPRGGGKTYKIQKKLLRNYFKKGQYFAVLRESQVEVDNMMDAGFWDNNLISKKEYQEHVFETLGNKIMIDGKTIGIAIALTTYGNFRGVALNLGGRSKMREADKAKLEAEIVAAEEFTKANLKYLSTIFFDEFEPLDPKLSGEKRYIAFKHIAETLFRLRPHSQVEVIFAANVEKANNEFLGKFGFGDLKDLTYGIKKTYSAPNRNGQREPLAVWTHVKPSKQWEELRDDSYCGMLSRNDGTEIFTSGSITKGNAFKKITGRPLPRYVSFNLTDGENVLSLWNTKRGDVYYITEKTRGTSYTTYCFSAKKAVRGIRLAPKNLIYSLVDIFDNDMIEFDNAKSFEIFVNLLPALTQKGR